MCVRMNPDRLVRSALDHAAGWVFRLRFCEYGS